MCPIWPLHLIILYMLALCPLWVLCQEVPKIINATFEYDKEIHPVDFTIHMDDDAFANLTIRGTGLEEGDEIVVSSENEEVTTVRLYLDNWNSTHVLTAEEAAAGYWKGEIKAHGNFLGRTNVVVGAKRRDTLTPATGSLSVVVMRPERVIDTIFTTSIALFVSLIFINFGCAMHWPTVKEVMKKPIGPAIGMVGQFLFMPLMTFALGFLIFPDNGALHLGMFVTGVAPGGGASNIWTFILGGNLDLSLAMTSISTLASFGFMPLWLFSLGQVVFRMANIGVPYARVAMLVFGLLVPLGIGLGMQKYTPRIAAFMVRILKGFSSMLLIFIIVFAIATNVYIFRLFTWQIVVAGMGIPWLGYLFGYFLARAFKRVHRDALAISIETGIQNTGIAIFLLRHCLGQPEADITTVIPVASAIMTPVPMMGIFIYQKVKACIINRRNRHKKFVEVESPGTPIHETSKSNVVATIDVDGK